MSVAGFCRTLTLLCLYAGVIGGHAAQAADRDALRFYFSPRVGGAYFSDSESAGVVDLQNPSQFPFQEFAIGANLNRYWGVELAVDYAETNLEIPGRTRRVAEYATWAILGQGRLRYPLLDDRLVPYLVAGAGVGLAEINDRNIGVQGFSVGGGMDESLVVAAGLGVEYFIADNVALLAEAKHRFLFETEINFQGRETALDLDSTLISGGLRVFLDDPGDVRSGPRTGPDSGGPGARPWRGYLLIHRGGAFFTNPDESGELAIDGPVLTEFTTGLGLNVTRHWGVEIVGDFYEPTVSTPEHGTVLEHTLWTLLGHVRYRYPMYDDRLVPFAVAGGGIGVMELNDRRVPFDLAPVAEKTETMPVASIGAGLDYYVADNVAFGVQARYIFPFDSETTIAGRSVEIDNQTVLLTAGVRIVFP